MPSPEQPFEPINRKPGKPDHIRGWRAGDPKADSILPGREDGAGQGIDDGPDAGAGAAKPRPAS